MVDNPSAPPGKSTKYARNEYERRFLLAGRPDGQRVRIDAITDRYIIGTRLRLRRLVQLEPAGAIPDLFKLTQKVPAADGGPGLMTNVYLSEAEYEVFAVLPADTLTKTRHSIPPFGVDVFDGPLAGLVLAEAEFETASEYDAFQPPEFAVAEVTRDVRFTGGALCRTDAAAAVDLLGEFGIKGSRAPGD